MKCWSCKESSAQCSPWVEEYGCVHVQHSLHTKCISEVIIWVIYDWMFFGFFLICLYFCCAQRAPALAPPIKPYQTACHEELLLFSKWFSEDEKYYIMHTSAPIVGGALGTYPLPKPPKPETPSSSSWVTKCSGLGVEWNEPQEMAEGIQTNPGVEPLRLSETHVSCFQSNS